jgi:pilus assembly protein CpaF
MSRTGEQRRAPGAVLDERLDRLVADLRGRLIERHRAAAIAAAGGPAPSVEAELGELIGESAALLSGPSRAKLRARVLRETVGLGPLEPLLADPEVEEVLVNGHREVWIERAGRLERREAAFESEAQLHDVVERILGPLGRRVDELSPIADGRLEDGSRVNVIIPPLAIDGVTISIRRFTNLRPGPEELIERGSVPAELMELLRQDVVARRSVLISGGTGSGKTTLLNALSSFIGPDERVITIEDAAELRLVQPHVVRLESRPPSLEGGGAVTIRDLVRNALRMRPDRLIIGEVRGPEAMDLIVALNTGHRGALSTVHANGPADALRRVEMLALMSDLRIGADVLREQLTGALDRVVHVERLPGGGRAAAAYFEVLRSAGGAAVREIWSREPVSATIAGA